MGITVMEEAVMAEWKEKMGEIVNAQGPSHDQPKEIPVEVTVGKIMEKLKPT
jgi:hypothetical protein